MTEDQKKQENSLPKKKVNHSGGTDKCTVYLYKLRRRALLLRTYCINVKQKNIWFWVPVVSCKQSQIEVKKANILMELAITEMRTIHAFFEQITFLEKEWVVFLFYLFSCSQMSFSYINLTLCICVWLEQEKQILT